MGEVDGAPVRFVVDTGASDIVLSPQDAARAGLLPPSTKYSRPSETANGVGYGAPMDVRSLEVGPIRLANVRVFVNQAPMSASLLGMTFLDRLDSFEVRGDQLFLRGRG
jgi:aspartyl protease family protein